MDEFKLSDRSVYATAWRSVEDSSKRLIVPNFGLYADFKWRPICRNEFIDWPDFSIPANIKLAYKQIINAYDLSINMIVELGCIGAHGRTGTMLSCMNVLDGMDAHEAIIDVKSRYCDHAVETRSQVHFIEIFSTIHGANK
jgi:hypothetical protein